MNSLQKTIILDMIWPQLPCLSTRQNVYLSMQVDNIKCDQNSSYLSQGLVPDVGGGVGILLLHTRRVQ